MSVDAICNTHDELLYHWQIAMQNGEIYQKKRQSRICGDSFVEIDLI